MEEKYMNSQEWFMSFFSGRDIIRVACYMALWSGTFDTVDESFVIHEFTRMVLVIFSGRDIIRVACHVAWWSGTFDTVDECFHIYASRKLRSASSSSLVV